MIIFLHGFRETPEYRKPPHPPPKKNPPTPVYTHPPEYNPMQFLVLFLPRKKAPPNISPWKANVHFLRQGNQYVEATKISS